MTLNHYYLSYREGHGIESLVNRAVEQIKSIIVDYFKSPYSYCYIFHLFCTEEEYKQTRILLKKVFKTSPSVASKTEEKKYWKEISGNYRKQIIEKVRKTKYGYRAPLYCF